MIIESRLWKSKRSSELASLFQGLNGSIKSVLNVGAGRSLLSGESIPHSGTSVTNVDIEHFPGLDHIADAVDLPFEPESFDAVLFLRSLHHVNDFELALKEAVRVIKPGGYILLSEPYRFMVSIIKLSGLDSHPENIVSKEDIRNFAAQEDLKLSELGRLYWFYYGMRLQKRTV